MCSGKFHKILRKTFVRESFLAILGELSKVSCACQSRVLLTSETEISGCKVSEKFTFP